MQSIPASRHAPDGSHRPGTSTRHLRRRRAGLPIVSVPPGPRSRARSTRRRADGPGNSGPIRRVRIPHKRAPPLSHPRDQFRPVSGHRRSICPLPTHAILSALVRETQPMNVRYIWRVRRPVPHLGIENGDYLIYEPADPDVWSIHRPLGCLDFGAVMGAEDGGSLELIDFTPHAPPRLRLSSASEASPVAPSMRVPSRPVPRPQGVA